MLYRKLLKKLIRSFRVLIEEVGKLPSKIVRIFTAWLIRLLSRSRRGAKLANSGFILPTVAMISLVVVLLSVSVVTRSFDRSKNASNYRVNQQTLNAAAPAIDRAKAKINALLEDPNLPQGVPSDLSLDSVLGGAKYDLGDEERLILAFDFGDGQGNFAEDGQIEFFDPSFDGGADSYENDETNINAWRFPVDTNNNGLFDSYTYYTIVFRTPPSDNDGSQRSRNPLDARSRPMIQLAGGPDACAAAAGTSADLVGVDGWYDTGTSLKKSFFTYVATVPITQEDINSLDATQQNQFEEFTGNQGFSALEFQQDQERIPLNSNAIFTGNDLEISSGGGGLTINGRVTTNSNLFFSVDQNSNKITFRQVSSPFSCFYEEEYGKIVVGGHLSYGKPDEEPRNQRDAEIHLFNPPDNAGNDVAPKTNQKLTSKNESTTVDSSQVAYNNFAYEQRINKLVEETLERDTTDYGDNLNSYLNGSKDPSEVEDIIRDLFSGANPPNDIQTERARQLDTYFRKRTRQVPLAEVAYNRNPNPTSDDPSLVGTKHWQTTDGNNDSLRPIDSWVFPYAPGDGKSEKGFSEVALNISGGKLQPPATEFSVQEKSGGEDLVGDRILVGHNLPELWWSDELEIFVGEETDQEISGVKWDEPTAQTRTRRSQVKQQPDLGDIDRDGFWETQAAEVPSNKVDSNGGLRIVTGGGLYLPPDDNTNRGSNVVWSDALPTLHDLSGTDDNSNGFTDAPFWLPDSTWTDDNSVTTINPDSYPFDGVINEDDFPRDNQGRFLPYLKMRATAVYHYNYDDDGDPQTPAPPIACVSSFYDPTDRETARNITGLPDVSGEPNNATNPNVRPDRANSNNGVVYTPPANRNIGSYLNQLRYQASLSYPNGRQVNPMLGQALAAYDDSRDLTIAEQSSVDAAVCAIAIYNGNAQQGVADADYSGLVDGTIFENAFLDARQIQAVDGGDDNQTDSVFRTIYTRYNLPDDFNTNYDPWGLYDFPIEQREPLEIRATVINLNNLRTAEAGTMILRDGDGTKPETEEKEYLLPNSGIIYATREDALPDTSDVAPENAADSNSKIAATDFFLDITRRPNGIVLIGGRKLGRADGFNAASNEFRRVEKGLTMVSNLPVYIVGPFNVHEDAGGTPQEEFQERVTDNNFYTRENLNTNFACRKGDPRLPTTSCQNPDEWRSATVLSDAITLLSQNFRPGFRNEGDYDLRNNRIDNYFIDEDTGEFVTDDYLAIEANRRRNGFWNNDFAINGLSSGAIGFPRNAIRTGVPAANIQAFPNNSSLSDDYYSGNEPTNSDINSSYFNNFVTPVQRRVNNYPVYLMEMCRKLPVSECTADDWFIGYNGDDSIKAYNLGQAITTSGANINNPNSWLGNLTAGTTAQPPLLIADQRYPRRVAFARNEFGELVLNGTNRVAGNNNFSSPSLQPLGVGCPLDGSGADPVDLNPADNGCTYSAGASVEGTNYGLRVNDNRDNNDALWFATTSAQIDGGGAGNADDDDPWEVGELTFRNDQPLAYLQPLNEREEFLLPDIATIPTANVGTLNIADIINGTNTPAATPAVDYDDLADYAVCIGGANGGTSQEYSVTALIPGNCNIGTISGTGDPNSISNLINIFDNSTGLNNFPGQQIDDENLSTPDDNIDYGNPDPAMLSFPRQNDIEALPNTNTDIYIYNITKAAANAIGLGNTFALASTNLAQPFTITLNGDRDTIFIFRPNNNAGAAQFLFANVQLVLNGVDPNNVFWLINNNLVFAGTNTLAGNFLGTPGAGIGFDTGATTIQTQIDALGPTVVNIDGGRFLGFSDNPVNLPGGTAANFNNALAGTGAQLTMRAIASQDQPLLQPVLQNQYLTSIPGNNLNNWNPQTNSLVRETRWLPGANNSEDPMIFNLVMGTGDTPNHPDSNDEGDNSDFNGGIANLPRYLEDWNPGGDSITLQIRGSLMQLRRSEYATAPFRPLLEPAWFNNYNKVKNYTGGLFAEARANEDPSNYTIANNAQNAGQFDQTGGYVQGYSYNQKNLFDLTRLPFYWAPTRDYGYDVGILSQISDLFARRFTLPPTEEPNEFFREASRDDAWIETLLCGYVLTPEDATTLTVDTESLQDATQREQFCNSNIIELLQQLENTQISR